VLDRGQDRSIRRRTEKHQCLELDLNPRSQRKTLSVVLQCLPGTVCVYVVPLCRVETELAKGLRRFLSDISHSFAKIRKGQCAVQCWWTCWFIALFTHLAQLEVFLMPCHNFRVVNRVLGATFQVVRVTLGLVRGLGIIYVGSVGNHSDSSSFFGYSGDVDAKWELSCSR
jgi:hypothetical protein